MSDIDYTTERWLPVAMPEYQDFYDVSDHGRVRNTGKHTCNRWKNSRHLLNPHKDPYQYMVDIRGSNKAKKRMAVHRLVALTFIGEPPSDAHEVAHNDGNPFNNHISNIRWATHKENCADKIAHGTNQAGEKNPRSKLTDIDVANIWKLYRNGATQTSIAKTFAVDRTTIGAIVNCRNWKTSVIAVVSNTNGS